MSNRNKLLKIANRLEGASPEKYAVTVLSSMRAQLASIEKDVRGGFYGEVQGDLKSLARDAMEVIKLLKSIDG